MSARQVEAVLFDLGETLIHFGPLPTGRVFLRAAGDSYAYLKSLGQPAGPFWLYRLRNLTGIRLRMLVSWLTGDDFDSLKILKNHGRKRGYILTEEQWKELNWRWYSPLCEYAQIEPGLKETLSALRQSGIRLGILSNTFVHGSSLDRHLEQAGLLEFLPVRVYSYQYSFRKPDRRIFLEAAERIGVSPPQILFVGDRLDKDVRGAQSAGMIPVLKAAHTNRRKTVPEGIYRIEILSELPGLIARLNKNPRADVPREPKKECTGAEYAR